MKTCKINISWIKEQNFRLDASVYAPEALQVLRALSSITKKTIIKELAKVWMPGRFKRFRTDNPNYGVPFLTASQILLAQPPKSEFISKKSHAKEMDLLIPKLGTILVTRSGTIGKCAIVNDTLSNFAISEDAIRIEPIDNTITGFLYTYITSIIGQVLLTRDMYGSVVDHIEPFHIENIPIPEICQSDKYLLNNLIKDAWKKRDEACQLLNKAEYVLQEILGLKPIQYGHLYFYDNTNSFKTHLHELDLRLDASHYSPPGRVAKQLLMERDDCKLLGEVTKKIFHPFRMNMVLVDKEYGVPFLGGKDIGRIRYFGNKYISSITDNYEEYLLARGTTLMTIGGSIGYISYVNDNMEGWAASQHVTRIVPDPKYLLSGYLCAYMMSEYAQLQVKNLVYGSVVDTIRETQLRELRIPIPKLEEQKFIHEIVEKSYNLSQKANDLEDMAQRILMGIVGSEMPRKG